jgi:hypothetical protein
MLSHKDIQLLEKKQRSYKARRFFKSFGLYIGVLIIIAVLAYPLLQPSKPTEQTYAPPMPTTPKKQPISKEPIKPEEKKVEVASASQEEPPKEEILPPKEEVIPKDDPKETPKEDSSSAQEQNSTKIVTLTENRGFIGEIENLIEKKQAQKELKQKPSIKVTSKKEDDGIEALLKQYQDAKTYENAIALSSAYLKGKLYQNSVKYALEANSIDISKEESWILFAKAKYYLGDNKKATKALESYLGQYKSQNAQKLLEKINKGELQ